MQGPLFNPCIWSLDPSWSPTYQCFIWGWINIPYDLYHILWNMNSKWPAISVWRYSFQTLDWDPVVLSSWYFGHGPPCSPSNTNTKGVNGHIVRGVLIRVLRPMFRYFETTISKSKKSEKMLPALVKRKCLKHYNGHNGHNGWPKACRKPLSSPCHTWRTW